jgi:hypothetical protein
MEPAYHLSVAHHRMLPLSKLDRDIRKARRWLNKIGTDYAAELAKLKKERADEDTVGFKNAEWVTSTTWPRTNSPPSSPGS